jgi:hypothetical protein
MRRSLRFITDAIIGLCQFSFGALVLYMLLWSLDDVPTLALAGMAGFVVVTLAAGLATVIGNRLGPGAVRFVPGVLASLSCLLWVPLAAAQIMLPPGAWIVGSVLALIAVRAWLLARAPSRASISAVFD